jgi:hypothetical protein
VKESERQRNKSAKRPSRPRRPATCAPCCFVFVLPHWQLEALCGDDPRWVLWCTPGTKPLPTQAPVHQRGLRRVSCVTIRQSYNRGCMIRGSPCPQPGAQRPHGSRGARGLQARPPVRYWARWRACEHVLADGECAQRAVYQMRAREASLERLL